MKPCYDGENRISVTRYLVNEVRQAGSDHSLRKKSLLWLELTGCSGNIISLLDGSHPDFSFLISQMAPMIYNNSLMTEQGDKAIEKLMSAMNTDYILAVEGAVATANNGMNNVIGRLKGQPLTALQAVKLLGEKASHVIAVGACASHGGVSAASPNPSQCVSVQSVIGRKVIQLPGCPCHPDWFIGTLAHLLLYGEPALDNRNRPLMFYSTLIHDRCPRRSFFDRGLFASKLGDKTCMFKLGCRGPVTRIDCPVRQWNQYVNWPIKDDTPCIGCAMFGFPDQMQPFISYRTARGGSNE